MLYFDHDFPLSQFLSNPLHFPTNTILLLLFLFLSNKNKTNNKKQKIRNTGEQYSSIRTKTENNQSKKKKNQNNRSLTYLVYMNKALDNKSERSKIIFIENLQVLQ